MAIKILQDELQFTDIQTLWLKTKNLGAKMVSKYFNFEVDPEEILIESILIQEGYAMITAVYLKIPLRFRLTVYQNKVTLNIITYEISFEERVDGEED